MTMILRLSSRAWIAAAVASHVIGGLGVSAADEGPLIPRRSSTDASLIDGFEAVQWKGQRLAFGNGCWTFSVTTGEKACRFFRIESENRDGGDNYRLRMKGAVAAAPVLTLEIEPVREERLGMRWDGFRYRYRLEEPATTGAEIEESIRWKLGGHDTKPTYWVRSIYFSGEYTEESDEGFSTAGGGHLHSRFGKNSPFDFQDEDGSALLVYPEEAALILNGTTADRAEVPSVTDRFFVTPENRSTPWKRVLITGQWPKDWQDRINRFNELWLALRTFYREKAGLKPEMPAVPLMILGPRFAEVEALLPELEDLGFKAVSVGPIWTSSATEGNGRSVMSVYDFTVAAQWGGIDGLQRVCAKAKAHGIAVISWFPAFHFSDQSPLLAENPQWKARATRSDLYEGKLIPLNLENPALRDRLMKDMARAKEAGLSGFWMDSYHNFAVEAVLPHEGWRKPLFPAMLAAVRDLEGMGFTLYAEAYTPFAISSFGLLVGRKKFYLDAPYRAPLMSPYIEGEKGGSDLSGIDYFGLMAFGSPLMLSSHQWPDRKGLWNFTDDEKNHLKRWNLQYGKALPQMKTLEGLVLGGGGVLWKGDDAWILFALREATLSKSDELHIEDLAAGTAASGSAGDVTLAPGTIYRLTGKLSQELQP